MDRIFWSVKSKNTTVIFNQYYVLITQYILITTDLISTTEEAEIGKKEKKEVVSFNWDSHIHLKWKLAVPGLT